MSTSLFRKPETKAKLAPRYRVLIHNDDQSPMDFVVDMLRRIFRIEMATAHKIMMEAHQSGLAHIVTEPFEMAEFHQEQAHSLARGRGYPTTLTLEPEE